MYHKREHRSHNLQISRSILVITTASRHSRRNQCLLKWKMINIQCFQSVFDHILKVVVDNITKEETISSKILVVSDAQFNETVPDNCITIIEAINKKYKTVCYKRLVLEVWNVRSCKRRKRNIPHLKLLVKHSQESNEHNYNHKTLTNDRSL